MAEDHVVADANAESIRGTTLVELAARLEEQAAELRAVAEEVRRQAEEVQRERAGRDQPR